jgi:hypothetical protein
VDIEVQRRLCRVFSPEYNGLVREETFKDGVRNVRFVRLGSLAIKRKDTSSSNEFQVIHLNA